MNDAAPEGPHPLVPRAYELARQISALVEKHWGSKKPMTSWNVSDLNDWYFYLGYVSAFRTFQAIRLLAEQGHADAALTTTRSLVETIVRSLYLVQATDVEVRELRLRCAEMYSLSNEERRRRALGKHASADELRGTVAELKTQLAGKPDPPVSDMAKALCLDALYDDLFRLASIPLHGSLLSVTDVFSGEPDLEQRRDEGVPLWTREPEIGEEVLARAIHAYVQFLELAETTVKLGVGERAASAVALS